MMSMIALLLAAQTTAVIPIHEWYPKECCSDRDCKPLASEEVQQTPEGYVINGEIIPYGRARTSPDEHFHICKNWQATICFFAPRGAV